MSERERLLDAAEIVLSRAGYREARLEDAALHAGLASQHASLCFRNKEDLFLSVIDRVASDWIEYMSGLARSERSVPARLQQMLVLRVLFRYDRLRPYTSGIAQLMSDLRVAYLSRSAGPFEREAEALSSVIKEGVERRMFSAKVDPLPAGRTLIVATNALLPHCLRDRDWSDRNYLERTATGLSKILIRGLLRTRRSRA